MVREEQSGIYHCSTRCVRRTFLLGKDAGSGKDYSHRRQWILQRAKELAAIFEIPVLSMSVLSNHYHLIAQTAPQQVATWSVEKVIGKACALCGWTVRRQLGMAWESEVSVLAEQAQHYPELVESWRQRLKSLSWFMRFLNEPIARRANREDGEKGHFWEERFHCELLADEGAVLGCMAYVDLNEVRACLAETPESSAFTSVYDRIAARQARQKLEALEGMEVVAESAEVAAWQAQAAADAWLCPIESIRLGPESPAWGVDLDDYLRLVDATGRVLRDDKPGAIAADLIPLLERLELNHRSWVRMMQGRDGYYFRAAGSAATLKKLARQLGQRWFRISAKAKAVYLSG